jgi:hypothetical protein
MFPNATATPRMEQPFQLEQITLSPLISGKP